MDPSRPAEAATFTYTPGDWLDGFTETLIERTGGPEPGSKSNSAISLPDALYTVISSGTLPADASNSSMAATPVLGSPGMSNTFAGAAGFRLPKRLR